MNLIDSIITKVKSLEIKSIHINGKLVDYSNIKDYNIVLEDIKMSSKYIPLLVEEGYPLDTLVDMLDTKFQINVYTNHKKLISLNITHHSAIQLLKRFVYIYITNIKFEFGNTLEKIYKEHFNTACDILINEDKIHKIGEDLSSEGCEIIDAKDKIVSPGFIDMHNHGDLTIVAVNNANG